MRNIKGFTLIETMFTIMLMGMLLSVAIPEFYEMRMNAKQTTILNDIHSAFYLARSEAIKRNVPVTVCASDDGYTCNETLDWSQGLVLQVEGKPIMGRFGNGAPRNTVLGDYGSYTFRSVTSRVPRSTITYCDSRGGKAAKALTLTELGRVSIEKKDAFDQPLLCRSL